MSTSTLISDARSYAGTLVTQAKDAMSSATTAVQNVGYTTLAYTGAGMPGVPDTGLDIPLPELSSVTLDLPAAPGAGPDYQAISAIDAGFAPTLGASLPVLVMPTKPNQVAEFLEGAPNILTDFTFPTAPDYIIPPSPTILPHDVPVAPSIMLPSFDEVAPVNDTVAPTNLDVTLANAYAAAAPSMITMINGYVDAQLTKVNPQFATQMAAIEAQLTKYLAGGTGLNAAAENAIYERARSKNNAEATRVRNAAYDEAASRGFTMPTGALMSAAQLARQNAADANAAATREIVTMQAEMEQKNLQFAVTTSASLRTTLLNATFMYMQNLTSINSQALDYAKQILNAIVETYNTAVKAFSLKLDAYKTDAQVYEIKVRGAMAAVELYAAEIKALEALVNVDRAAVDVYRARIDALTAYAGLYRSQIDAVLGRASLEKMKMEIFQLKVQAYSAQVQAKNAEWQGYTAAVEGETAKVRVYAAQVDAFGAQVNGFKASIEAKSEVVRAQAISNQAKSAQYSAQLSGYAAIVSAKGEVARTQLESQRQVLTAFQVETSAAVAKYQVKNEYYKAAAQIGIENARLSIHAISVSAENLRKYGETLANLSNSNAHVFGQLGSSAMAGMNSLASETLTTSG